MHYQDLLEATIQFTTDGAYERALQNLNWFAPNFDMAKNAKVFEGFLAAWHSLRAGPIDKEEIFKVWMKDVEPYARFLKASFWKALTLTKSLRQELRDFGWV